jgi:hypothetical protein
MIRIAIDLKASTGETDDETLFQVLLETLLECHIGLILSCPLAAEYMLLKKLRFKAVKRSFQF